LREKRKKKRGKVCPSVEKKVNREGEPLHSPSIKKRGSRDRVAGERSSLGGGKKKRKGKNCYEKKKKKEVWPLAFFEHVQGKRG